MTHSRLLPLGAAAILILALVFLAISRYDWNVSALLHVSRDFGEAYSVPAGTVLYEDGGYDGMLYYQIARDIPEILKGEPTYDSSYRWQRILLPTLAFVGSLGNDALLPYVILIINVASLLGSFWLFLLLVRPSIHTWTAILNPAALIGTLFATTEPLSLFWVTLFLFLWKRQEKRITGTQVLVLSLALLARETILLLIFPLAAWYAGKRQWRDASCFILTLAPYLLWMAFLFFKTPFSFEGQSTGMLAAPFTGILALLKHIFTSPNAYVLSSGAFFLFFAAALILVSRALSEKKDVLTFLLLLSLLFFLFLDAHIWGVITSVGRVVPALYVLYALFASEHDSSVTRTLSGIMIAISLVTALGIAFSTHPYTLA